MQWYSVLPLAAVHTLGNLLTNCSLGSVAVSFTHTIKVWRGLVALRTARTPVFLLPGFPDMLVRVVLHPLHRLSWSCCVEMQQDQQASR